jgi:hypothetical protein
VALHIVSYNGEGLLSPSILRTLRDGLAREGRATLWAPSFAQVLSVQRELVKTPDLGMGVSCATPSSWLSERWELWGDGTHFVDGRARTALLTSVLADHPKFGSTPGVVRTLGELVSTGLPWLTGDAAPKLDDRALTNAERDLVACATTYAQLLSQHGLVEQSQAACAIAERLAEAGVTVGPLVLVGFDALSPAMRALVAHLARVGTVVLALPAGEHPAHARARHLADLLAAAMGEQQVVRESDDEANGPCRDTSHEGDELSQELAQLSEAIFVPDATPVEARGAVSFSIPAGPAAEATAIADELLALIDEGALDIVVAAPNAARLWHELAPRLLARGVKAQIDAQYSQNFVDSQAGRAFLQFSMGVAHMAELAPTWPASQPQGPNLEVGIGDMAWWPPRDLSDFLMSEISDVPAASARRLDATWRSNRLLSPQMVLNTLLSERETSRAVVQATQELLRGRLGASATRLLTSLEWRAEAHAAEAYAAEGHAAEGHAAEAAQPSDPTDAQSASRSIARQSALREATEILKAAVVVAKSLSDLGISADPQTGSTTLGSLVDLASIVLGETGVLIRHRMRAGAAVGASVDAVAGESPIPAPTPSELSRIRLMDTASAASLPPASTDALLICGLSSEDSPISRDPSVAAEILAVLGIEEKPRPMDELRARFQRLCKLPRRRLVLERTLFTADGKDSYSSVGLIELLASYGIEGGGKPSAFREALRAGFGQQRLHEATETNVSRNVSPAARDARPHGCEWPLPTGAIDPSLTRLVSPLPEGVDTDDEGKPLLSASQIETYLECPYKWFSLRRLRLADADAGFGGAEMGTFVHRVLEVTHQQLLDEAARANAELLLAEAARRGIELQLRELPAETGAAPASPAPAATDAPPAPGTTAPRTEVDFVALAQQMPDLRLPGSRVDSRDEETLAHATELLDAEFDLHLAHQYYLLRGRRPQPQALVPHDTKERGQLDALHDDLRSTLAFEAELLRGFEPRFFEWTFGRTDAVDYAGVRLVGTIDRVDVDAHGQAVVIDYKHKRPAGFAREYDLRVEPPALGASITLPRRVQSLIYAQVVRRYHPELAVRGAVYLSTKGDHELAGAVDSPLLANVFGERGLSARRTPAVAVDPSCDYGFGAGERGMAALLDATEDAIAERLRELLAGNIEARPLDAEACMWCPVLNCTRRLG